MAGKQASSSMHTCTFITKSQSHPHPRRQGVVNTISQSFASNATGSRLSERILFFLLLCLGEEPDFFPVSCKPKPSQAFQILHPWHPYRPMTSLTRGYSTTAGPSVFLTKMSVCRLCNATATKERVSGCSTSKPRWHAGSRLYG